ncbi:serine hydrolase [Caldibacillus lycopersici]|uniref:Serine hydrolase n=1 Tax=Perspicuibacillus lycopersici TaxID=1325689 RepID=A0AAE3ITY4_9BACI|nr:serine hydrolase [Perspicuibacillus lycopersici]MCU9614431.1 serine hydrolase [Perspicuibacillus lycopersici]
MKKTGFLLAVFLGMIILYIGLNNGQLLPEKENTAEDNPPVPTTVESGDTNEEQAASVASQSIPQEQPEPKQVIEDSSIQLYSPYAMLVHVDNHEVLYEKNSEETMYPASLTKIMTAIIAIENIPDLQTSISLSPDMFPYLYAENASLAGFMPNEEVSAEDLLYGTLLPSGADAAIGLANYVAGSEEEFVKLMNDKAEALGMENTNFTNTTGLHDPNHYSTAKDISILLQYALENETFKTIFTSKSYTTAGTNLHPDGITVYNTMFNKMDEPMLTNGEILGGKTGFTDEAGLCLASLASIDGETYILVTAGAQGNNQTEQYNISDAFTVYEGIHTKSSE